MLEEVVGLKLEKALKLMRVSEIKKLLIREIEKCETVECIVRVCRGEKEWEEE